MRQGSMRNKNSSSRGMKRNMPTFESYDFNNDGYLTKKEMDTARNNRMTQNAKQGKNDEKCWKLYAIYRY